MIKEYKADIWIILSVTLLIVFSIGAVYSASSYYSMIATKSGDSDYYAKLHIGKVILALAALFIFSRIDYKIYEKYGFWMIIITILLLIAVFFFGITKKGSSRWLPLGPLSFQPSDIAKYTLMIYLSVLIVRKKEYIHLLYRGYMFVIGYVILITLLIIAQPNFSTAMIVFGTSILLLSVSPAKPKHILFTVLSVIPFAIIFVLNKPYIMSRLDKFSQFTSSGKVGLQLDQAIIGLGNGGIFGVGPGNSYQKELFLPEAYNDFIFSIVGEEYGFIGTVGIILIFVFILIRGYRVAMNIEDDFGKYLAFGITTIITAYAFVNMSVATGLIPTTGVPVPFISYGGTALIINSAAIGILVNISRNAERKENNILNKLNTKR